MNTASEANLRHPRIVSFTGDGDVRASEGTIAIAIQSLMIGGAERAAVDVLIEMLNRGIAVDLIVMSTFGPLAAEIPDVPHLRIFELGYVNRFKVAFRLKPILKNNQYLSVLSFLDTTTMPLMIAKPFWRQATRYIIVVQNQISKPGVTTWKQRLKPAIVKLLYRRADSIICVSRNLGQRVRDLLPSHRDISVIYNPVSLEKIAQRSVGPPPHRWLENKEVPVLIGCGRFIQQKNFSLLLDAFDLAIKTRPLRLILLGAGRLQADLELKIEQLGIADSVSLPGLVENPIVYFQHGDLFVMSSRWEGMPLTMLEAIACGLPVVSTDCPDGPREILKDGSLGQLVPVENAEALASAILEQLQTPRSTPSQLRTRAQDFAIQRVVDQYLLKSGYSDGECKNAGSTTTGEDESAPLQL